MPHAKKDRGFYGGSHWTAAGSEAPRRFWMATYFAKAVSPLRSATAIQNPVRPSHPLPEGLWRQAFRQQSVWLRAVKLGLTVGLLQAAINQGDHWVRGEVDKVVILKSIVSPLIGFTLVLFSAAQTWVQRTLEQTNS